MAAAASEVFVIVALVFLASLLAAWAHWTVIGWAVIGSWLSVYVAAYVIVFVTAAVLALRSKRAGPIGAAVALAGYFLLGHVLWVKGWGLEERAVVHLGFAALFVVAFRSRAAGLIGLLFTAMVAADAATLLGWLSSAAQRPRVFLAWSHPDVLALLGHAASIVLGLWSDGAVAQAVGRPWRPAGARAWTGGVSSGRGS